MFSQNSTQKSDDKTWVDDVFSTTLYTGNGSTQTITNGIDLAGKGGLVWTKNRDGSRHHFLYDTVRGVNKILHTSDTNAQQTSSSSLYQYNSNGYSVNYNIGVENWSELNSSGLTYASWTFRKSPRFFDVVTYTGNGVAGRQIPHSLGVAPGMIVVKDLTNAQNWMVFHRSNGSDYAQYLNATDAKFIAGSWGYPSSQMPTSTSFTVGGSGYNVNDNGATYVAYLFAHDPSADGIIQCGSYVGNDSSANGPEINLGWEPQYVMIKRANSVSDWWIFDQMRGFTTSGGSDAVLYANTPGSEVSDIYIRPTATGFKLDNGSIDINRAGSTMIYLAIRRPNKPPTTGTQVFKPVIYTGNNTLPRYTNDAGFAVDVVLNLVRDQASPGLDVFDRLRGGILLRTGQTDGESGQRIKFDLQHGIQLGNWNGSSGDAWNNTSPFLYGLHYFRRAPGFMDVVCYTSTTQLTTIPHSLGVVPELIIDKRRDATQSWYTSYAFQNDQHSLLFLDRTESSTNAPYGSTWFMGSKPTSTTITCGASNGSRVAYLFASLPGISKVGSYTGNGTSLNLDCGFSTGARFFLCKRTDSTGDWFTFDTARGIISSNDPHLSLNTTAAEVTTDDSVDPFAQGITVNQNATTNINVLNGTYIYLAIA